VKEARGRFWIVETGHGDVMYDIVAKKTIFSYPYDLFWISDVTFMRCGLNGETSYSYIKRRKKKNNVD
jgi:hypothetical protein